ncbi:MerR family transcriptional regulator [Rhodococcoides kyotonense]|uniref:DNA-binding transcriptional regulator, MerR family n=1 Tax=Rhodococcoides kyotonense TaxID=398843 RepID=A0A239KVB8_9NOCA|nr:MerR family transcriptional regulator [Rhodococcus kyotonensis]SNT21712.1 DNA-binding transcriptional regulator, MerR family [Rhodococcus kyotonensis]
MRIGVLAQAAGTTPRAVRHYHRLGLLPEPTRTSSGYRDYSMSDLVRLMRIRRLASSGVPLGAVAAMTTDADGERREGDVIDDLTELVAGIEREQEVLETRKTRLLDLLADARDGRPLSALPRQLADKLADLIDSSDDVTRVELERERDHLEVLALSGGLSDDLAIAMTEAVREPDSVASYLAVLARWSSLHGTDPEHASDEIDSIARDLAELMVDVHALGAHTDPIRLDIDDVVPDPAQRAALVRTVELMTEGDSP